MNAYTINFRQWPFPVIGGGSGTGVIQIAKNSGIGVAWPGFRLLGMGIGCQSRSHPTLRVVIALWHGSLGASIVLQAASEKSDPDGLSAAFFSTTADSLFTGLARYYVASFDWRQGIHVRWSRHDAPVFNGSFDNLIVAAKYKIPLPATDVDADLNGTLEIEALG